MYVLLIVVCPFVLFLLTIGLSVLLRYTNSYCPFGIFKLFILIKPVYSDHLSYVTEQITQWSKEKVQKDKQRSTKHTYKTKDRVTWTPLKIGGELRCSGRVSSSCSTSLYRNPIAIANLVPKMFTKQLDEQYLRLRQEIIWFQNIWISTIVNIL
jgi:hypothetical protein